MTSRVGPRVRHSRGMRSFPRGVPRKFKRRDHPTLLSRGDKCMYVYSWYAFFFFFFFYALPIIISHRTRRPRVDAKRPPDVVDRFWRQNFILVAKLIAWGISIDASRRFCSVNLEQETAVTDRTQIYRVKIGHRRSATIRTRSFRSKKLFRFRRLSRQIALIGHFVTRSKLVRSQTRARYVSTAANSLLLFSTSVTNRKSWEK